MPVNGAAGAAVENSQRANLRSDVEASKGSLKLTEHYLDHCITEKSEGLANEKCLYLWKEANRLQRMVGQAEHVRAWYFRY